MTGAPVHKGRTDLRPTVDCVSAHPSLTATERYLGVKTDFADAPCDHLGLKPQR